MRYRTLKLLRTRKIAREKRRRATRWMKYFISSLIIGVIFLVACALAMGY